MDEAKKLHRANAMLVAAIATTLERIANGEPPPVKMLRTAMFTANNVKDSIARRNAKTQARREKEKSTTTKGTNDNV